MPTFNNPVPDEMTPTDYINLSGFEKHICNRLEKIEERIKNLEKKLTPSTRDLLKRIVEVEVKLKMHENPGKTREQILESFNELTPEDYSVADELFPQEEDKEDEEESCKK